MAPHTRTPAPPMPPVPCRMCECVLKATSICMNSVRVRVCESVHVITKTDEAELSTCKSDQKFKLMLKFWANAVQPTTMRRMMYVCMHLLVTRYSVLGPVTPLRLDCHTSGNRVGGAPRPTSTLSPIPRQTVLPSWKNKYIEF